MPDFEGVRTDMNDILAVLQQDVKDANEKLQSFLLAENERLRNENDRLKAIEMQNERLNMIVHFYRNANWFYVVGMIILTLVGCFGNRVWDCFYYIGLTSGVLLSVCGLLQSSRKFDVQQWKKKKQDFRN